MMYSLPSLRRTRNQVDALRRKLKPVLAILRLRNLAMEFCDEYDEAALHKEPRQEGTLRLMCIMFPPRVGQVGFRVGRGKELVRYLLGCIRNGTAPQPREVVFTVMPWARRGPHLRPDLWDRPVIAA